MENRATPPLSPSALIKQYLNICNDVLIQHKHGLALPEIVALLNRLYTHKHIGFTVVDDDDKALASFTTRFVDGQFTPVTEGEQSPDTRFALRRAYLEEVVEHAHEYMQHPLRLDWDWLTGKAGRPRDTP